MTAPTDTPTTVAEELLGELRASGSADNVAGMARFGISSAGTLGTSMPVVRRLAAAGKKRVGSRDAAARHELAALLWASGVHEARIMASIVDAPALVTEEQAEAWALDLDSWDTCDQLCMNLLRYSPIAWQKAAEWPGRPEEFVKRAGFVLGAVVPADTPAEQARLVALLDLCVRECTDDRNFVKKAVNWQIRDTGKRSAALNAAAIATCERILAEHPESAAARWTARGALRELKSDAIRKRLGMQ